MSWRIIAFAGMALAGCYDARVGPRDAASDGSRDAAIDPDGCLPLPDDVAFWAHLCLGPGPPSVLLELPSWCRGGPRLDPAWHEILPVSMSANGDDVVVEAILISSARWPYDFPDGELRAARMRYRIRPTARGPLIVLERADQLALGLAIEMWEARNAEREAGLPAFCVRVGGVDIWLDRRREALDSVVHEPLIPLLPAGLARSRDTDRIWILELQLNPLGCPAGAPCGAQELAADGAWIVFGTEAGTVARLEYPWPARRPWGCVLQPACELRETGDTFWCSLWVGTLRCDDAEWLDRACAARGLDELPVLTRWPCHTPDETLTCPVLCPP